MGYLLLTAQFRAIEQILEESFKGIDSIELLWIPGGIQVTVWFDDGTTETVRIDEDGHW